MDKLDLTEKGLGWDGYPNSSRDGWVITHPLAIGLSWRPATGAEIKLKIEPPAHPTTRPGGESEGEQDAGSAYVRYSADASNWSDRQILQSQWPDSSSKLVDDPKLDQRTFTGQVQVPHIERAEYDDRLFEFMRSDVPWGSDEEAATRWIISKDSTFFQRHKPFVGYVQFLVESEFIGGRRITGNFGGSELGSRRQGDNTESSRGGP